MIDADRSMSTFWSGDAHLRIDFAARCAFVDGIEIHFTPTEFDILACLARRAGTVVSTAEIIESVWGAWYGPTDHVFVHVHHIRRKLGPCGRLIATKRKAGYLMRQESTDLHEDVAWSRITREYSELLQQEAWSRGSIWLLVDRDRRVTWVSDSITTHLGWLPAELMGKHPWVIAMEEEVDRIESAYPITGGRPLVAFDARFRHADGRAVTISVRSQVIMGPDGRRLGGIGEWTVAPLRPSVNSEGSRALQTNPFRLRYDADHVLTAVEPHQPFLGWDPDVLVGTYFSLGGLDEEVTRGLMSTLQGIGVDHDLGATAIRDASGAAVCVHVTLHLELEEGELRGYSGEVRVLD